MFDGIFGNLDTFDGIHTSDSNVIEDVDVSNDDSVDVDSQEELHEDTGNFYDTFTNDEEVGIDSDNDFEGFVDSSSDDANAVEDVEQQHTQYRPTRNSQISFGLGCHCTEYHCGCRSFEGTFGTVCTNCGHGYDKHF